MTTLLDKLEQKSMPEKEEGEMQYRQNPPPTLPPMWMVPQRFARHGGI
jgi:hypothetical protein